MVMTEKSCPPLISFIPWLFDRIHRRAFVDTQPLIDGMDAPAFNGIKCATVEVSCNHSNQQERPG